MVWRVFSIGRVKHMNIAVVNMFMYSYLTFIGTMESSSTRVASWLTQARDMYVYIKKHKSNATQHMSETFLSRLKFHVTPGAILSARKTHLWSKSTTAGDIQIHNNFLSLSLP